jgi:hypothetical protein
MINRLTKNTGVVRLAAAFVLTLALALPARAQSPEPGPEHAMLKKLEGQWTAKVKLGDEVSTGAATYKMECGGLWLTSTFKGELMGQPFEGRGVDGYDPESKKFVSVWVDNMVTKPMSLEGTYDKEKKTLTMIGTAPTPNGPVKHKLVTHYKDEDHHTFSMYPEGAGDTPVLTIEYTRKK